VDERVRHWALRTAIGGRLSEMRHLHALRKWSATDERLAQFYSTFVSPDDLCIDIGSNYGNRTKVFVKLGARVVAVEPQAACARVLQAAYGSNDRVEVLRAAAGDAAGEADLMIADVHVLSSLSRAWVSAVLDSGRFGGVRWSHIERVSITTVDDIVRRHGAPRFVKIDVEGYEYHVLRGMSELPPYLSFEITTPECLTEALACIDYITARGNPVFNYSLGESMQMEFSRWIGGEELKSILRERAEPTFGDVYVSCEAPILPGPP
jgi:FkbM family methyltransferase